MPCLQPYGEYGGQAATAANDDVNNKTANSFFIVTPWWLKRDVIGHIINYGCFGFFRLVATPFRRFCNLFLVILW